ncbi:hypothetical protein PAXRUDRAFT_126216, partial [Paxillus rubicundulus Ve08.2h10]
QKTAPDPLAIYEDYSFAGQPPSPFIMLAKHILSVTANLASCEHLFSTFSTTLMKLHNQLGTCTLQSLAELKMHIHDQQLQKGVKDQIK